VRFSWIVRASDRDRAARKGAFLNYRIPDREAAS
jgi:hypothetical protein